MPLLWKRVKGPKISQLFSDHLESQRRQRGHLVVETGFSTSLVDLFVKNRDRLKKPNSSTKKKKKKKDQIIDYSSSSVCPSTSPSSSPLIPRAPCSSPSQSPVAVVPAEVNDGYKETDERPNAKGVLGALLWMFFVVVVALWTKRFAVGLTMSALLLFFVEFIGKKTFRFLEPCPGVKSWSRLLMQRIFQVNTISFFRRYESFDEKFDEEEEEQKLGSHDDPHGEIIQIASEPKLMVDGCIHQELTLSALLPLDIFEPKKKGKRAKMKSKIKRLFKGGSSSSKKEIRDHLETGERIVPILEEEKDPNQNEQKSISRTSTSTRKSSSSSSLTSITTTQEDEISTIFSTDEENLDGIFTGEEERERRRRRGMVFISIIMCVIALVGLTIGGKFLAMALVVFCFLMLNSGEILRRYIHTYI